MIIIVSWYCITITLPWYFYGALIIVDCKQRAHICAYLHRFKNKEIAVNMEYSCSIVDHSVCMKRLSYWVVLWRFGVALWVPHIRVLISGLFFNEREIQNVLLWDQTVKPLSFLIQMFIPCICDDLWIWYYSIMVLPFDTITVLSQRFM